MTTTGAPNPPGPLDPSTTSAVPLLEVRDVEVSYGEARALFGVSLTLARGATLAVLGRNGAGKSSLAAAVGGAVIPSAGSILVEGRDVTKWRAHRMGRLGIAYVPEERAIFPHLSVIDNLRVRLRRAVPRSQRSAALARALETFPVLAERRSQAAGTLSGGEQQMLSLARVLAAPPRLLIADEMSLGLAPMMVDLVFDALNRARAEGVAILLIEQFVERALDFADRAVILRRGRVAWEGAAQDARSELVTEYLGDSPSEKPSTT
ncbi:MAG: ABC transporter ATP-binding protein [Acidimicrobiia bacterium]|nr:ABC transporter ATP-binding protein [Acidimicrobiia bacterium]